jgi:uncharacterized membrane protein
VFVTIFLLDIIYLNINKKYYENKLGISYTNIKQVPAVIAWIFITISYYFIVEEQLENKYLRSLMLGIGMYGVYNATNYAILPNYSLDLAVKDTLWGLTLFTIVTFININLVNN